MRIILQSLQELLLKVLCLKSLSSAQLIHVPLTSPLLFEFLFFSTVIIIILNSEVCCELEIEAGFFFFWYGKCIITWN